MKKTRVYKSNPLKLLCLFVYGLLFPMLFAAPAKAGVPSGEVKIPESLHQGLQYLLTFVAPETADGNTFDSRRVAPLLEFVAAEKDRDALHFVDEKFGAPSAYHEFLFEKDMDHVLRFSFNPEIPSFFTTPSSVRLASWNTGDGQQTSFPNILNSLNDIKTPLVITGVETLENTPDLFTGGYYKYDLERTILVFKFQGRPVLISLSKQTDTSGVGKKGVVLGKDDDWNYLYSGITGLNKTGLGWVDSYMYDSYSIIVYYEIDPAKPLVKCGAFKWLRAGWKNINVVKKEHIFEGLKRFATTYKEILESPGLPDAGTVAAVCRKISGLGTDSLKIINRSYINSLKERYAADRSLSRGWVADLLEGDAYVERMDRHELQSVLVLEYLKSILGKPHDIDVEKI